MPFFGSLFGNKAAGSGQTTVKSQIPQVEEILKARIVAFQDRTKLHYVLIFPVMHKVAVKLYVDDFGFDVTTRLWTDRSGLFSSQSTCGRQKCPSPAVAAIDGVSSPIDE